MFNTYGTKYYVFNINCINKKIKWSGWTDGKWLYSRDPTYI